LGGSEVQLFQQRPRYREHLVGAQATVTLGCLPQLILQHRHRNILEKLVAGEPRIRLLQRPP
jgi:hypothetical protein